MQISDNPADYGLPVKFASWFAFQKDLIEGVLNSQKKFVILNAPTGIGKSLVGMALANMLLKSNPNTRAYYVVGTKALQDQIEKDFGGMGVRTIRGKDNFPCIIRPNENLTASDCQFEQLTGKARDCPAYKTCPYFVQRDIAQKSRIVVFNYAFAVTAWNYTESWARAGLVVFDECDQAPEWLSNMVKIRFSYRDFNEYGLEFPGESLAEVKTMIAELGLAAMNKVGELKKLDPATARKEELVALKRANN